MLLKPKYLITVLTIIFLTSKVCCSQNSLLPFAAGNKTKTNGKSDFTDELSFSLGFGTSYGGYGAKLGFIFSSNRRFGIQAGAGYYFDDFMYSGALKVYPIQNLYIDFKYGTYRREFELAYNEKYDVDEVAKIVSGPGVIIGYELMLWNRLGINGGGGINYATKYDKSISYAYDIGLLYWF